jgi:hypothetical protein
MSAKQKHKGCRHEIEKGFKTCSLNAIAYAKYCGLKRLCAIVNIIEFQVHKIL